MASSSSSNKPQFLTNISCPLQLHQLTVPPAFVEEHGSTLVDSVVLETPNGERHRVKCLTDLTIDGEEYVLFEDGWEEFAKRFSLEVGSYLVFRYEGNSQFHVHILSEIAYPEFNSTANVNPDEEIVDALERARPSESDNPYFVVRMCESYLEEGRYRMLVPYSYSSRYMTSDKKKFIYTILLQLEGVPNGKIWQVNVITKPNLPKRRSRKIFKVLSAGWRTFAIENELSVIDACIFELIDKEAQTYMVHIFRGISKQLSYTNNESDDDDEHNESDDDDDEHNESDDDDDDDEHNESDDDDEHNESDDDDDTDNNQGITCAGANDRAKRFRSDNPYFRVDMRNSYLSATDFRLAVPREHAKTYLLRAKSDVLVLKLSEEHVGKTWQVNFVSQFFPVKPPKKLSSVRYVRLTTGWRDFAQANRLQVGDACVFELTDQISMTYQVHIYRERAGAP